MKQKIFIYLFIFSILIILFQYVNSKRVFEDLDNKFGKFKSQTESYKDSIVKLQNEILELSHFNLNKNEDATSYFEKDGHDINSLIPSISDNLYDLNFQKGGNSLIPYGSSDNRKMLINTVKILNHRWIIADFSDGEYWGELFITYFVNADKTIDFELAESFLYPIQ